MLYDQLQNNLSNFLWLWIIGGVPTPRSLRPEHNRSTDQSRRSINFQVPYQAASVQNAGEVPKQQGDKEILQRRQSEDSLASVKKGGGKEVKSESQNIAKKTVQGTKNDSKC